MKKVTVIGDPVRNSRLRTEIEKVLGELGFSLHSEDELPPERADGVWCTDPSVELRGRLAELPEKIFRIFQAQKSPIYAPDSHYTHIFLEPQWNVVMTWNRAYEADHIIHYDIPMPDIREGKLPDPFPERTFLQNDRCVATAPCVPGAFRFFLPVRTRLFRRLARGGFVDLCAPGWPASLKKDVPGSTAERIALIGEYPCALVIEDMWAPGYVSESLMECILAGTPVIYFGDDFHAERRFPGTFEAMERLDEASFFRARESLRMHYAAHRAAVLRCRGMAERWNDSFLEAVKESFRRFED